MIIRHAKKDDYAELARLRWDFRVEGDELTPISLEEFESECLAFFEGWFRSENNCAWLAELNGKVIGHIFVHIVRLIPRPMFVSDAFGYLTNSYVVPESRDSGVGTALIKQVISWAGEKDLELLLVYPSEDSISFYKRHGFSGNNETMELKLRH